MGGVFSAENIVDDPEESATPQISPLSKLFSFVSDPRSPGNFSRTPILVQDQLVDPRSPGNEEVERTPLFHPATPLVRFKLDNEAFQPSPLTVLQNDQQQLSSIVTNEEEEEEQKEDIEKNKQEYDAKIKNIQEDYDYEIIGERNEQICSALDAKVKKTCETQDTRKAKTRKDNQLKKRFNSKQKTILKTVLFKPYEELNEDEVNLSRNEDTPKKTPLGDKSNVYINRNIATGGNKLSSENRFSDGGSSPLHKLPLRELSLCDKENFEF